MTERTDWDDDIQSADDAEDVIELTDIAEDVEDTVETDDIIELTDIAASEKTDLDLDIVRVDADKEGLVLENPAETETVLTLDSDELGDNDFADGDFETASVLSSDVESEAFEDADSLAENITMEQVEAALERVIEKKFADKIETILFEVMENVIEKELGAIKESLQKDLDQIGNA